MAGHGAGCLTDQSTGGRNIFFGPCGTDNNQKWYMDAQGRLHSRIDEIKCLDLNKTNDNLYMEACSDSFSQRFSYPNSFPIVTTNARTAYNRRQQLNRIYGTADQHVYGKDSRSIIRYNHPDQVRRNLCPYWESSFSFKYTMQNYALSTSSVIEVKSTSEMDQLLLDESRVTSGVTKVLVVKRPKLQTGYFRLGDYASNKKVGFHSSLLVKGADGTVLKEPTNFVLVWNGTGGDAATPTSSGSFWKPVAPERFTCLGHVWQQGATKPATNLVRCIQDRFVESAPSSFLFDNNDAASKTRSEVDLSVQSTGSTSTSLTPGTFVSKASHSAPATEEFMALKKGCILGEGKFPFCDANDSLSLSVNAAKDFKIPYAKLQPCYYEHEDHVGYGLVNDASSTWQNHAIELFKNPAGSLGYKHVGASTNLGESYCLGSVVFGSSSIKHDLFIHGITKVGSVTQQEAEDQKNGELGNRLSKMISGDFVFLFPCSGKNSVKDYKASLAALATSANTNGGSENGVVNVNENLGELGLFGGSKWTSPHYCGISEEPTASGGCRKVDVCFFEPGGCKPYDQLPCKKNIDCKGGICNTADSLCGHVRSFVVDLTFSFPMAEHTVNCSSVLEFDFRLVDEVEGHAICLDEDLNEDVEIPGSKRCFRLAGSQSAIWKEVWNLDEPGNTGEYKHYKVKIGSLTGGAGNNKPYISWGAKIKYIAIVQDNDANENIGESTFKNLQLYHDNAAPVETVDPGPSITGTSIEIDVSNAARHGTWKVNCTRLDGSVPDQPPQSVYKYDGKSINAGNATNFKYKFDGLLSGYEYTARLFPVDGSGNQLQGSTPQETVASTFCCCNCNSIHFGDTTGRPIGLKAYQVKGFVMFNFTDNSLCADAYAFTRSALKDEFFDNSDETRKSVFTPNYNYYPKKKCGGAPVLPGKAAADDLKTSQLEVGAAYRYCVRAVAQFYSADSLHSSDEHCKTHFVRWQASMSGKVTTAPLAGSLPIDDVAVSWELLNPQQTVVIASGSAVTKRPGTYAIEFDELHNELDRDNEFPVRIKFSKNTTVGNETITHQFLCNEGSTDCSDGTIAYLKHLTFEEPVVSYDNSSVPVRGRVTIWEPDGCPVIGAEVCLKIKHPQTADTTGACVKTDHNGDYNVPAAIGSTVGIEVSYNNHTMNKAPENSLDYNKVFFINVNKRYVRNDFLDVAKAKLVVEVVGGLCNKTLGVSQLEATVNGCDRKNWKKDLSQQFFKGEHWVPAHVLDLKVVNMSNDAKSDFSKILDFFATNNMTKTIDLLEAGDMQDETKRVDKKATPKGKSAGTKSEESYDKVRFQYDGELVVDFRFMGVDLAGNCTLKTVKPQGTLISGTGTTTSFHVTTTGSSFRPKVTLKYSLLPDLTCDILADEIAVRVINKIGIDADFEKYASTLQSKAALLNRLKLCSDDGGCNFPVDHDIINGKKTNAHMLPRKDDDTLITFAAGRPNLYGDFRKDLILEVLDKNLKTLKTHRAEVVVVGDYVKGPGESFALPTYKPILILRDPPGGLSQSIYENVQTSIKVKSSTVERVKDTTFHYDRSIGGEHEYSMCAGFGAMACKDVLEIEGGFETGLGVEASTVQQDDEDSYTSEFTTTWSYATSDDPVLAGRKSDVIVIPNLNVQYHIVTTVAFYGGTSCQVNTTDTVKFSLTDPGNKPALSFLSVYNIETHQLPDLKKAISDKKAEHDKLAANHPNKTKTKTQLKVLEDALTGWNQTMTDYDSINKNASKNKLDIAGREWFTKWASTKDKMEKEPTITDHWSNLAPEVLTDRTEAFNFDYIKQAKLASTDKADLKETNRIQFSGGGGTMEFVVDHAGASELMRLDKNHENGAVGSTATLEGEMEISAGASFGFAMGLGFTYESSTSGTVTDESGRQTTVSFVLGDEQEDDEFVVDIYVDPTYGTFVFHTVSGCSRAPWESNTKKGEDLSMSMMKPDGPVMPDDAIVVDVTLLNAGENLAVFQAYVDHTTNPGGLRHFMGGVGLEVPIDYTLGARSEITTKVEIRRGPKGYKFPATTMYLVSLWDELGIEAGSVEIFNFVDANKKKWILFEEPCPRVEWAGPLKRERKASVTKNVKPVDLTVFNPQKAAGTFESIAKNSRLSNVYAWYRQLGDIGDTSWKKAQLADKNQIDFANIPNVSSYKETSYGYSKIPWDIGNTLALTGDGAYEVMIESVCETLPGAPDEFNKFQSDLITVVVDRVQPELYGKALPVRDVVVPGEEIVLVFTESIQCELPYRFTLNVTVAGLNPPLFNERDLKIDCQGRKLGFQLDPTKTGGGWDVLMGREMTVTVDQIKDLEGNVLPNKITFKKTLANLNLKAVTSTFDFRLATANCTTPVDESNVKNKIATELALSDTSRVTVVSSSCDGNTTVAKVKISPTGGRRLRNDEEQEDHNALSAFYALFKLSFSETESGSRKLMSLDGADYFTFSVDNMELVPGEADLKKYGLNAKLTPEEEMIMAAAEACDSTHLEQKHQLLKMEHSVIEELETHLEELDHKMEVKLDEIVARLLETKTPTTSESVRPEHVDLPDEKQDLAVLLAQLREEQKQARFWNVALGLSLLVGTVVSLYARAGR
ncbi:Cupin superfamily protein [Seminavis robusta]|uniref:Cupin superfamily protein n=1 Tax=Seminavis robusta TaxID=568900 RepID=A0A9N8HNF5_9STRA|nr:Cupin superfamily protein [Seminavis robusta]|eukprot:Sro990_g228570.1 Cupin superfamily protein (2588) ;mRNA; f:7261-15483